MLSIIIIIIIIISSSSSSSSNSFFLSRSCYQSVPYVCFIVIEHNLKVVHRLQVRNC